MLRHKGDQNYLSLIRIQLSGMRRETRLGFRMPKFSLCAFPSVSICGDSFVRKSSSFSSTFYLSSLLSMSVKIWGRSFCMLGFNPWLCPLHIMLLKWLQPTALPDWVHLAATWHGSLSSDFYPSVLHHHWFIHTSITYLSAYLWSIIYLLTWFQYALFSELELSL